MKYLYMVKQGTMREYWMLSYFKFADSSDSEMEED